MGMENGWIPVIISHSIRSIPNVSHPNEDRLIIIFMPCERTILTVPISKVLYQICISIKFRIRVISFDNTIIDFIRTLITQYAQIQYRLVIFSN